MKTSHKRTSKTDRKRPRWPQKVTVGERNNSVTVPVYQRKTPAGLLSYMVANWSENWLACPKCRRQFDPTKRPDLSENAKCPGGFDRTLKRMVPCNGGGELHQKPGRRWDCYPNADQALAAAEELGKKLLNRNTDAASMTREQARDYISATDRLKPYPGVTLDSATVLVADLLGDKEREGATIGTIRQAWDFFKLRHKSITPKTMAEVRDELIKARKAKGKGKSERYLDDIDYRLSQFAKDCTLSVGNITQRQVEDWIDGLDMSAQSKKNYYRVLFTAFNFAVKERYAHENPMVGLDAPAVEECDPEVFTPSEMQRLLDAARGPMRACIAICGFAGLRSAEVTRLEWSDVRLDERVIVLAARMAKNRARRVIPITDNLAAWLALDAKTEGRVWTVAAGTLYHVQKKVAAKTAVNGDPRKGIQPMAAVEWKHNALRHSFVSYRLAATNNDHQVALEAGNSATMIHKHYKNLAPNKHTAELWFSIVPGTPPNVLQMPAQKGAVAQ